MMSCFWYSSPSPLPPSTSSPLMFSILLSLQRRAILLWFLPWCNAKGKLSCQVINDNYYNSKFKKNSFAAKLNIWSKSKYKWWMSKSCQIFATSSLFQPKGKTSKVALNYRCFKITIIFHCRIGERKHHTRMTESKASVLIHYPKSVTSKKFFQIYWLP